MTNHTVAQLVEVYNRQANQLTRSTYLSLVAHLTSQVPLLQLNSDMVARLDAVDGWPKYLTSEAGRQALFVHQLVTYQDQRMNIALDTHGGVSLQFPPISSMIYRPSAALSRSWKFCKSADFTAGWDSWHGPEAPHHFELVALRDNRVATIDEMMDVYRGLSHYRGIRRKERTTHYNAYFSTANTTYADELNALYTKYVKDLQRQSVSTQTSRENTYKAYLNNRGNKLLAWWNTLTKEQQETYKKTIV